MESKKCELCGHPVEFRREGNTQGLFCTSCDWALVTTYIPEIELDETIHSVFLKDVDSPVTTQQIRLVSELSGKNFLESKTLLSTAKSLVFEGGAPSVVSTVKRLKEASLMWRIEPEFKYL
jgi:hypothetical protein